MANLGTVVLALAAAASLRTCGKPPPEVPPRARPSRIDSVAVRDGATDSLRLWDVTDSLRDPRGRIPVLSTHIFQDTEADSWRMDPGDYARIADSLGVPRIAKADLDGNGRTDLIASVAGNPLAILDDGDGRYRTLPLVPPQAGDAVYPVLRMAGGLPEILCYYFPWSRRSAMQGDPRPPGDGRSSLRLQVDTVVYHNGELLEKNAHPVAYRIEQVHFEITSSWTMAPVYDLRLDRDGKAVCVVDNGNDTLTATLDAHTLNDLFDWLCYVDVPRLNDSYYLAQTVDAAGCSLTVTYDGGKTKTVSDYGQSGTRGLVLLYGLLTGLRHSQRWTPQGG